MKRPLVFIPTYNEKDNIPTILKELIALAQELDILVLDDNSPDGTGEVLDRLAADHSRISVIHRSGKNGIGSAHQDGILWAYEHGYRTLITMDGDFTHPTHYVPDFLKIGAEGTVVVGSRYILEGSLKNWDIVRFSLSHLAHFCTRRLLGLPYDATSGYRLYRLDKIPREVFGIARSPRYAFFFESLHVLHQNRFPIEELGISLPMRSRGYSKMTLRDALHSASTVFGLWWEGKRDPGRFLLKRGGGT